MKPEGIAFLMAIGFGVAGHGAHAEPVVLPISISGITFPGPRTLVLNLKLPATPVSTQTLADGTRQDLFQLASSDYQLAWIVGGDLYGSENYSIPAARVTTSLSPSGSSSLGLTWNIQLDCHGGCLAEADLHLLMQSKTASLYADPLTRDTFLRYSTLAGQVDYSNVDVMSNGDFSYGYVTRFSASTVPEPTPSALMLAGLAMFGLAWARYGAATHRHDPASHRVWDRDSTALWNRDVFRTRSRHARCV
jgi:hypothetical protein